MIISINACKEIVLKKIAGSMYSRLAVFTQYYLFLHPTYTQTELLLNPEVLGLLPRELLSVVLFKN